MQYFSEKPLFSIAIPCYNSFNYLLDAVVSIKTQHFQKHEIIIVDDQSSCPKTLGLLKRLEPYCYIYRQQHRGAGAARNLAIRHARGKYIIFLDSDDMLFPAVLEAYSELIYAHQPSMIFGNCYQFSDGSTPFPIIYTSNNYLKNTRFFSAFFDFYNHTSLNVFLPGLCIRRDLLNSGVNFLEQDVNGEDLHFYLQLVGIPTIVQINSLYTYAYRSHSCNSTSSILRGVAGIKVLLRKHRDASYPQDTTSNKIVQNILSCHARGLSIVSLQRGYMIEAVRLYFDSFSLNIVNKKYKFMLAFWVILLLVSLKINQK